MDETCTCKTCKYSRTQVVHDPIVGAMRYKFESMPEIDVEKLIKYESTKCHLQGPPQVVASNDWCYKWEEKTTSNFGELK